MVGKERKEVTGIRHSFIYSFIQQMVLVLSAGFEVLGLAPIELVFWRRQTSKYSISRQLE